MDLFSTYQSDQQVNAELIESIEGLSLYYSVISPEVEKKLLDRVDQSFWITELKRRVQHYGYKYDYRARRIDQSTFLGTLPDWIEELVQLLQAVNVLDFTPDQVIINEYEPGQGIAAHIDCEPCFGDCITTLSLGTDCIMNFETHPNSKTKTSILLPRRSMAVIKGEARYKWFHSIPPRKKDSFNNRVIIRKRRVSITFRKVILT